MDTSSLVAAVNKTQDAFDQAFFMPHMMVLVPVCAITVVGMFIIGKVACNRFLDALMRMQEAVGAGDVELGSIPKRLWIRLMLPLLAGVAIPLLIDAAQFCYSEAMSRVEAREQIVVARQAIAQACIPLEEAVSGGGVSMMTLEDTGRMLTSCGQGLRDAADAPGSVMKFASVSVNSGRYSHQESVGVPRRTDAK